MAFKIVRVRRSSHSACPAPSRTVTPLRAAAMTGSLAAKVVMDIDASAQDTGSLLEAISVILERFG
jgi:hypothetical protein